jgi:hypothetical protein
MNGLGPTRFLSDAEVQAVLDSAAIVTEGNDKREIVFVMEYFAG